MDKKDIEKKMVESIGIAQRACKETDMDPHGIGVAIIAAKIFEYM
jgi:hypothetical protein